ncbi:neural cell adhesion molecule 1-like [Pomacea canaliculata]|uniref:neural cell adhesion molecule 1-like n=1 Tax=Pomacea canaliculata TaxID=400727 RepID=UPI000D733FA1|nr:neural cell adhesion molecule 1-like [Pomacea canaliculata]
MYGQDALLNCSSSASVPRETNLLFSNWKSLEGARYRKENDYVIIANFSRADEGMYRCSIRLHEIGDSKNYELHLLAAVPPKVNGSMTFWPPEPKVGQNLKIICDISAKPDPVYQFYKVEGNNTRIIQSNDVTNGTLLLKNLTQADDGEYKCVATNGWGSASQTISIDVLSPLAITYAGVDSKNKLEGSEGRLKCNVTGDPEPVVSWKRGNFYFYNQSKSEISGRIYTKTERATDKIKGSKIVVHTLIFRSLEASDMSTYTCEASNMFARVNATVPLAVQFKPNFSKQMTTRFYSWRQTNATLTCTAIGNPEPLLSWFYNGTKIENRGDLEIKTTVVEETSPVQVISTLKVSVSNGNNNRKLGNYTCKAENKHGHTEKQLELVEAYLPDAPEVTLVDLKPSSLGLSVKPPLDNGGLPIKKYNIEYTPKNNTVFTQKLDVSINPAKPFNTYVKLTGLQIKTTYMINVSAVTDVGRGLASCITASTLDVCEPDNVTIISDKAGNESQHYTLLWIPEYSGRMQCHRLQHRIC